MNYLSVFDVLKSTRLTPLGMCKDSITSAVRNNLYYKLMDTKAKDE